MAYVSKTLKFKRFNLKKSIIHIINIKIQYLKIEHRFAQSIKHQIIFFPAVYHGGMKKAVLMKARDQGEGFLGSVVERRRESEDEYWDIIIIGEAFNTSPQHFVL